MSLDLAWQIQNSQQAKAGLHCYYTWEWRGNAFSPHALPRHASCLWKDSPALGWIQVQEVSNVVLRFVQVNIFLVRMIPLRVGVIAEKGRNHDPIVAVWGQCCLLSKFDLWYVCWHCYTCLCTENWLLELFACILIFELQIVGQLKMRFSYSNSLIVWKFWYTSQTRKFNLLVLTCEEW